MNIYIYIVHKINITFCSNKISQLCLNTLKYLHERYIPPLSMYMFAILFILYLKQPKRTLTTIDNNVLHHANAATLKSRY